MIGTIWSMKAHCGLVLYKRHNSTCVVNRSKIPLAKRRFWMDCDCQIWIVGGMPTGEIVPRQPTGCTDIKKAEEFVRSALKAKYLPNSTEWVKLDTEAALAKVSGTVETLISIVNGAED